MSAIRGILGGLVLLSLATGVQPACVSFERGGLFAKDRNEVFVSYFGNRTFYRDVEFDLTEQIVNEILSRPGLHLTSRENAEVLITGEIVKVLQTVLSEDPQQEVTSKSAIVTAEIKIVDARTGDVIKKKTLSQRGEFVESEFSTSATSSSPNQDLDSARREVFVFLARDIVRELEKEF